MVSKAARQNLEAHIAGERARNLDALLAPLAEHPRYVVPNYIIEGRAALRAMYERSLPHLPAENFDEYLRALDDPRVTRWGDNHCVLEYTDDYPLHQGMVVVVHFENDRVKSENTYFTSGRRFNAAVFDEAFARLPGVTRIE
jgi:hypothetical protein